MTPAERREFDALCADLMALRRAVGNARGLGVNTSGGATHYRTTQLGFPAELTTDYHEASGYGWKRKRLVPGTAAPFVNPGIQLRGDKAYSFVGDESLVPGTDGWMEPSPDGSGFVFIHRFSQSGSGADDGGDGGGCDLETVSFDVVTGVSCDSSGGLTVTTRRISVTGCGLSVAAADASSPSACYDGTGEPLAGHPGLTIGLNTGLPLAGPQSAAWSTDHWTTGNIEIDGPVYRFDLSCADGEWTLSYFVDDVLVRSGTATSQSSNPFLLTFAAVDFSTDSDITVEVA